METVWDKLQRNAYRNTDPYPKSISRPIPVFSTNPNAAELRDYANKIEDWEKQTAAIRDEQQAWSSRNAALHAQFRIDLETETDMLGHPKAELLYDKAYARGHAYGVDEIYSHYMDMLELVK